MSSATSSPISFLTFYMISGGDSLCILHGVFLSNWVTYLDHLPLDIFDGWHLWTRTKRISGIFWSKLKFERDKRSFGIIQDHSEHFRVRLGIKKIWKFNCLSKLHYLTLNDLRWICMTSSDFSSYSDFNLLQKMPDIRFVYNKN